MRILFPVLALLTLAAAPTRGPWTPAVSQPCAPPDSADVLVDQLRVLAAQYHPEALTPDKRDQSQVIAMIVDNHCRVLHHGTMRRRSERLTVDSTMAILFPEARREPFLIAGITELGQVAPGSKGAPWLVWLMLKS